MIEPAAVKRIAVLGAGTIGGSWVAWFLARGMQVTVWDPRAEAVDFVRSYVTDAWPAMARLGMTADASPNAWRLCATAEEAVADAEFIQENAPERTAIKRELYARLDPVVPAEAVLASSTSGLIMSEMQAGLRSAARFVVGHPFNPPHLIPLVEVVGGRETASETITWCLDFYRHIGKRPIHIRQGGAPPSGEPAAGGAVAGGSQRGGEWACVGRGRRHCDQCRARLALGGHGPAHDLPSGRRRGRHHAYAGAVHASLRSVVGKHDHSRTVGRDVQENH
jgi:3-hydroxyacyl-CoA dehydrogenase, NAD binding domain